jgi:hypothetical protein
LSGVTEDTISNMYAYLGDPNDGTSFDASSLDMSSSRLLDDTTDDAR